MRVRNGFFNRVQRLYRYRLVVPLLRGRHPPEYTARGVLFGLLVAMTPTVGIQMVIVLAIWIAVRALRPAWDFSLVIGIAYTWLTNVFTAPPLYYVFLLTGRIMMGRWDLLGGYDAFHGRLDALLSADAGPFETFWVYMVGIFDLWGVPMFLGSVPWAILSAWLGYRWSLRLVRQFHVRRLRRLQRLMSTR